MSSVYYSNNKEALAQLLLGYEPEQIFILADENTQKHCLEILLTSFTGLENFVNNKLLLMPAGEQYKNLVQAVKCWQQCIENKASKNALLINLGGGVVSDLGGFVASNYKRGIDFINIPTSSLAMIDACYGGKTAINFDSYKNQIGTFANPKAIYIDTTFLDTLPERHLKNGFIEAVKHHLLFNPNALEEIGSIISIKEHCTLAWMQQSLDYKKAVVAIDPLDKKERQALNFGHSIGHAIEALAIKKGIEIYHGEAVLLGMIEELKMAEKYLDCPTEIRTSLMQFKSTFFPALDFIFSKKELLPYLSQDKKNDSKLNFSLIKNVGTPSLFFSLSESEYLNTDA